MSSAVMPIVRVAILADSRLTEIALPADLPLREILPAVERLVVPVVADDATADGDAPAEPATPTPGSLRNVRDVADPHFVPAPQGSPACQQVLVVTQPMPALRRPGLIRTGLNRAKSLRFQQSSDPRHPARNSFRRQFHRNPPGPVSPAMMPEHRADPRDQLPDPPLLSETPAHSAMHRIPTG